MLAASCPISAVGDWPQWRGPERNGKSPESGIIRSWDEREPKLACLDTQGELVWQKDFGDEWGGKMMSGWGFAESVVVDGDLVVCTPGGPDAMMVALDKKSGDEIWKCKMPGILWNQAALRLGRGS